MNTSPISSLTTSIQEASTSSLCLSEHRSHVLNLKKNEEGIDFTLNIDFDRHSVIQVTVKCKRGKVISLCKNDQKIQVSNFYKPLQTIGCSHIQEIKKVEKQMILQQQLQSTISISTDQRINTQTTPNINSVPASQSRNNAKRRITSESQRSLSTIRSRSTTNITRFGSWNFRSCYRVTKRELTVRQLKRYQIEVAALAETNIPNSGIYVVNEYTFIYSGAPEKERTRAAHGAAGCLGSKAPRSWRNSGSIWRSVNSTILAVRIKCQPIPITIIAVYAPVNPSNGLKADIEARDEFYKALQSTIDNTNKGDIILIMGDFNARIGVEQASSAQSVVGKHAIDKQNQNSRRLVDFCLFNGFVITNTLFPH
ncbi:unnamed protein product, partial [Rotaria magnacalcarata]